MNPRCRRCKKVSYASHLEARWAILTQWRYFKAPELWFYECPHAPGTWHLTSRKGYSTNRQ